MVFWHKHHISQVYQLAIFGSLQLFQSQERIFQTMDKIKRTLWDSHWSQKRAFLLSVLKSRIDLEKVRQAQKRWIWRELKCAKCSYVHYICFTIKCLDSDLIFTSLLRTNTLICPKYSLLKFVSGFDFMQVYQVANWTVRCSSVLEHCS